MNMTEKVARAIAGHYGKEFDDCPKDYKEGRKLYRAGEVDLSDANQDDHLEAAKEAIEAMRGNGLDFIEKHLDECFKGFNDTRKICYFTDVEGELNSYKMGVKQALLIFYQNLDNELEKDNAIKKR